MRTAAVVIPGLLVAAVIATYVRYQSLDPCTWLEKDLAANSDWPLPVVRARIQANFLMDGITDPNAGDCLLEWWDWRGEGMPADGG